MASLVESSQDLLNAGRWFGSWVEMRRGQFARWRLYRRTLWEMASLSNRDLADLGLHRSELKCVAWQAVQKG